MTLKTALVFPGQGSQGLGMLEHVPENDDLDRLLDAAEALSGLDLCVAAAEGPADKLADTRFAQPLLYLADWSWGVALIESGIEPVAVAGHSLGEFAALAIAGVFSVEAGLELVVERSKLMAMTAKSSQGTMSAVLGLDREAIAEALIGVSGVWIANDNAPGQIVISGTLEGIDHATAALSAAGARRVVPLAVAGAFHSPLMSSASSRFAEILEQTQFFDSVVPVYQNTDPSPVTDAEIIRQRLASQMVTPVRWTETMAAMVEDGIELLVEAGPGAVLTGLAKRVDRLSALAAESSGIERILEEVS